MPCCSSRYLTLMYGLLLLGCESGGTAPTSATEALVPSLSNGSLISRLEFPQQFAAADFSGTTPRSSES